MDELEKYIVNNKSDFDESFDKKEFLWSKIDEELHPTNRAKVVSLAYWKPILKVAALLAVICSFGIAALFFNTNKMAQNQSMELREIDAHYVSLIDAKYHSVKNNTSINEEDKKAFFQAISELEKESEKLQKELNKNFNNSILINAMVNNYKERLRLLDQLLHRIEKSKRSKNEKSIII